MKGKCLGWKRKECLTAEERLHFIFDNCVEQVGECLIYSGYKSKTGYGRIRFAGKSHPAHRFVFQVINNIDLTRKEYVCHTCDNRGCINPDHLFLGDQLANMRDMLSKGRGAKQKINHCKEGHPFDFVDKRGIRRCSICKRNYPSVVKWRESRAKAS